VGGPWSRLGGAARIEGTVEMSLATSVLERERRSAFVSRTTLGQAGFRDCLDRLLAENLKLTVIIAGHLCKIC
jgi:hypothetical protein